jgi:glycosyltransferase involved in cell wall biosynthesis
LRWLRDDLPHVYVPNCMVPAYFAAAEARRCGARTVGVMHSDDDFYWGVVEEFVYGSEPWRVDALVTVSHFLHDAVQSQGRVTLPVHEIPYGVAIPPARAARPTDMFRLVYTGRLVEEQKRISDLTRAFCRVALNHANLEARIVGGGPAKATVRDIIRAEGMDQRVTLTGRIDPARMQDVLRELSHLRPVVGLRGHTDLLIGGHGEWVGADLPGDA